MANEIQNWADYGAIPLKENPLENSIVVRIKEAQPLPERIEEMVDAAWNEAAQKKPLQDNQTTYLESMSAEEDRIIIDTAARGFRYTQAFNRTPRFHAMTEDLNRYKLITLSTMAHILTKDDKILFGMKKNQHNQITGFAGFPNVQEDSSIENGQQYLDLRKTILNRLRPEIGDLAASIKDISAMGITYVDTPALRGTEMEYLVRIDETAGNTQRLFSESEQFGKELLAVDFNPASIRQFITLIQQEGKTMSRYALGGQYLVTKAFFGEEEAEKYVKNLDQLGIRFSTRNETDYFRREQEQ